MKTAELRKAIKAVDPEARVAKVDDDHWTIRTYAEADAVKRLLPSLGLTLWSELTDYEGSRWDAITVLHVVPASEAPRAQHATKKKTSKSPAQLDRDIVEALSQSKGRMTDQQLEQMRHEALAARNDELARMCGVALGQPSSRQASARRYCERLFEAVHERRERRSEERARERSYTGQMGHADD